MPRGDKTGPNGMGSMTGRRLGLCVGNSRPGFSRNAGFGNGFGNDFGRGFGRGHGRGFSYQENQEFPNISNKETLENELRILKEQMSFLEKQLSNIDKNEKQ